MQHKPMNLQKTDTDQALYFPAVSSTYLDAISKQCGKSIIPSSRQLTNISNLYSLNFLDDTNSEYFYPYVLYSAGQALNSKGKPNHREDMIKYRNSNTIVIKDSGGYQLGKGKIKGDWADPNCPTVDQFLINLFDWLSSGCNYAMTLDVPSWTCDDSKVSKATNIKSFDDALNATIRNNDYFIRFPTRTKFLNVIQGSNEVEVNKWYESVKKYCSPSRYKNHFKGWAFGAEQGNNLKFIIERIVHLHFDGLLDPDVHDWIHVLGHGDMKFAIALTEIMRMARRFYNPKLTVSYDSSTPFMLMGRYKKICTGYEVGNNHSSTMKHYHEQCINHAQNATDHRSFEDVVYQDGIYKNFISSPISKKLMISDICVYPDGSTDHNGNTRKSSLDTFSDIPMMSHSLFNHIGGLNEALSQFDQNRISAHELSSLLRRHGIYECDFTWMLFQVFSEIDRQEATDKLNLLINMTRIHEKNQKSRSGHKS